MQGQAWPGETKCGQMNPKWAKRGKPVQTGLKQAKRSTTSQTGLNGTKLGGPEPNRANQGKTV